MPDLGKNIKKMKKKKFDVVRIKRSSDQTSFGWFYKLQKMDQIEVYVEIAILILCFYFHEKMIQ